MEKKREEGTIKGKHLFLRKGNKHLGNRLRVCLSMFKILVVESKLGMIQDFKHPIERNLASLSHMAKAFLRNNSQMRGGAHNSFPRVRKERNRTPKTQGITL